MTPQPPTDLYLDPDTGILRNSIGARTQHELDQAESAIVTVRAIELAERPIPGRFDLTHLRAIHRHLLADIYPFAGEREARTDTPLETAAERNPCIRVRSYADEPLRHEFVWAVVGFLTASYTTMRVPGFSE